MSPNKPSKCHIKPGTRALAGLVIASALVCWWRAVAFFDRCVKAAASLHDSAFFRMLRAPLSFFDSNPAGRILNRFSKDVALVDEVRVCWTASQHWYSMYRDIVAFCFKSFEIYVVNVYLTDDATHLFYRLFLGLSKTSPS